MTRQPASIGNPYRRVVERTSASYRQRELVSGLPPNAAAAFLARYGGRTLEAYRHDLRYQFQWAADQHLGVLTATRAHLEMYRSSMEPGGLAASTIDRRLSTVCSYYRFAHIDGRIPANPAQYVRRPKVQPVEQHAMDRSELGHSSSRPSTTTDATPRSPCCSASTDSGCRRRARPTSRTSPLSAAARFGTIALGNVFQLAD